MTIELNNRDLNHVLAGLIERGSYYCDKITEDTPDEEYRRYLELAISYHDTADKIRKQIKEAK